MRLSVGDVFAQLRAEGLATPDADAAARAALAAELQDALPWYVHAAVGIGAWVATALLVGAVFTIADLESNFARAGFGAVLIVAGVWLRRTARAEFVRQAAVASSLAGQAVIIGSINDEYSTTVAALTGVVLSIALVSLMPDRVHRFLSTLIGVGSAAVVAIDSDVAGALDLTTIAVVVLTAYMWRGDLRRGAAAAEWAAPVRYALVVGLFGLVLFGTLAWIAETRWLTGGRYVVTSRTTIAITVSLLALAWKILDELGESHSSIQSFAALAGVVALGASTLSSPGIIAGVAALVLAFDRRDRVLLGLAVVFLLVFGSMYYYSLHLTLLEKSGVLAGSGALLLAIRQRLAPSHGTAS